MPIPELEIIVLALRMLLKYRDRDVVGDLLKSGHWGMPDSSIKEFRALRTQTTDDRILCVLEKHVPIVSADLIMEFLYVMNHLHTRVQCCIACVVAPRALASYRRLGAWHATRTYWNAVLQQTPPFNRLGTNSEKRKILPAGGVMLTFVGADGAGKSTAVKEVARWLGWQLNVKTFYMGTTRPSTRTKFYRAASSLAAMPYAASCRVVGKEHKLRALLQRSNNCPLPFVFSPKGAIVLTVIVPVAKAPRGCIVIFDRYPMPNAHLFGRGMDGPAIATLSSEKQQGILKKLAFGSNRFIEKCLLRSIFL